eukprot:CAMPEP_0177530684 /NCGR_PEP_ID=MMETSP0369-20130122/53554_1 /TAXON_ID=447022 ORGANISM="Scrippsiella hangoei-like, Strain SHHI-4" /NCGR_SAMPLE_ID=MMETSP0369 /ASSEMBLY_ACC=CAM_ASM_000364 /LENGTH=303 /DNA_ID=CAMNT_0019011603 /DNA_START=87 /DNA_END=995 /DNA_ORIENTATION=+
MEAVEDVDQVVSLQAHLEALRGSYSAALASMGIAFTSSAPQELEPLRQEIQKVKEALRGVRPSAAGSSTSAAREAREARARRMPIDHSALASMLSPLPSELREQCTFGFDTARYPFREVVAEVLGVSPEALPSLHQDLEYRRGEELHPERTATRGTFVRRWKAARGSPAELRFQELLRTFVSEFVAPHMACDDFSGVAYQREVTFRVHGPSSQPVGEAHVDAEYHHPPAEVNWWLPLMNTFGSNTLHVESAPGKGDFAPVELEYGQVLRFYGNLCHHYTVANTTDVCRVSFDFRVLSMAHHDP